MIKLVLIDFDDTLCLTEKSCYKIENMIAAKMGFTPMIRSTHIKNWGIPLEEAITERIPGIDAKAFMLEIEKEFPRFIKNGQLDKITDINLKTLVKIRKKGIKTAILTARSFIEVRHLLDINHPLSSKIDAFYHKDNSQYLKPDPKVFDQALRHFNTKPDECIYIGDSTNDAVSAKEAGLHFIALLESGLRTEKDFHSIPVDFFAIKFEDILSYIDKNSTS